MKKSVITAIIAVVAAVLPGMAQQSKHNFETAKQLEIFNTIYKDLDLYYVDTLQAKKNIENALLYMFDQLDPYTVYYPEDKTSDLKQMTTGKYAGIGALIGYRKQSDRCIISKPYENMPAATAGLRPGDVILAIDGKDTGTCGKQQPADFSSSVSNSLRGEPGSTFTIKVQRPGTSKPLTFKITRKTIVMPSVTFYSVIADSVGYVMLNGYTENTSRDLRRAMADLKKQGAKSLILDLRGNPGGLMGEAVKVVNLFVPRGKEVLRTKGKVKENSATYKTQDEPLDLTIPLVVLTDFGTASAAEITSGALQDYDRAVVLGRRTYGKGLVQETHAVPYGGVLKLTTSKYYIPSGRCVQAYQYKDGTPVHLPDSVAHVFHTAAGREVRDGGGITPDVEVKLDSLPNLLLYLEASDQLFDFCANYRNSHSRIAPAKDFKITDEEYEEFKKYLKDNKFTYDRQSLHVLSVLRTVAQREGYAQEAKAEIDSLEAKLKHNEDFDYRHWEKQIREAVESMIVENYYYDRGLAEYELRDDKDVEEALKILRDSKRYNSILGKK